MPEVALSSAALRVSGLRAGYGETVILEDVALELPERGSLAVLGRNGVGKTTLLATIMGHTTFHSGNISFAGANVERLPVYERVRQDAARAERQYHDVEPENRLVARTLEAACRSVA